LAGKKDSRLVGMPVNHVYLNRNDSFSNYYVTGFYYEKWCKMIDPKSKGDDGIEIWKKTED